MQKKIEIIEIKHLRHNEANVFLRGDLSLKNATKIKEGLAQSILQYEILNLFLTDVKSIDLTCIQLVYSLKKTAFSQGKQVHMRIELGQEQSELIEKSGFKELIQNGKQNV